MHDETRPSLQEILLAASELVGQARRDYVEHACAGNPALRDEVESLLAFDTRTPSILDEGGLGRVVDRVMRDPARGGAAIGDAIGPYRLLDVIGEGGMGVVYRASQQVPLEREVALKLVRKGLDTERVVARFEAERQVLARMDHPGIARVFDAGATPDGRPYFVMELVAGQSITSYADDARLSVRDRVALLRQACLAIQHAHQKGVIHRDLKPSNVLAAARDDGHDVKVIDFGIAKAIVPDDEGTLLTREGQFVGTPNYMSPEQAGVIAADVDTRTDVYALGVVLYELLSGRRPHEFARATPADIQRVFDSTQAARPSTAASGVQRLGVTPGRLATDVVARIADARNSTPSRLKRDLAGDLDNIVLKAIEKSPERRYASMEQFADDLARFLDGRPVLARPDTWPYRAQKFAQRHTLGVGVGATAILFLCAFVATTVIQSRRLAHERDRAVAAEQRARLEAETASRTADFLMGIFKVSDPSESRGRSVTALELLDRGAAEIGQGLADQPALQSRLMVTMGNVYKQLGLYGSSTKMLQQAVDIRDRTAGTSDGDRAYALVALGDALRMAGDRKRAAEILERGVALQAADPTVGPRERSQGLNNLGLVAQELGNYDQAADLLGKSLAIRRAAYADAPPAKLDEAREDVALSLNNLGQLLSIRSRFKEAEAAHRESLKFREQIVPPRVLSLAMTRLALAITLTRQGRLDEAEPLIRQTVADRTTVLGPDHPRTIDAISELANLLHDQGDFDDAEVNYRRVVAARAPGDPSDHAVALNNLASLLEDRGDFADARPLFERSLELRISANGPNHPSVATALNNLGRLNFNLGAYSRARALLDQAYTLRRERFGSDNVQVAATQLLIARVEHAQHRLRDAETGYRAALTVLHRLLPPSHPTVVGAEVSFGRLLVDLGRSAEAVPLLRHAVEIRATPPPPATTAWRLADARLALGRALVASGKVADGRVLIESAAPVVLAARAAHPTLKAEARAALTR